MEPLLDENCKTDSPPKGPSLLDLPDELVTLIFRFVYVLERDEARTGTAAPLKRIRVNKRTFSLAYPVFLEHIGFPLLHALSADVFLGGLLQHSRHMTNVKSVKIHNVNRYQNLIAGVLVSFTTLRSLEFADKLAIPACVTSAISQLTNLQSLRLTGDSTFEDRRFTLANTTIRQLTGTMSGAVQQLLGIGTSTTLEVLELQTSDIGVLDRFLRSIMPLFVVDSPTHNSKARSLRAFELAMDDKQPSMQPHADRYKFLFNFLALAEPGIIKLSHISKCPILRANESFPFVRHLVLQGYAPLFSSNNLEALYSLLSRFPFLTHLTLTSFPFHDTRYTLVSDYVDLPYAAFVMRYPIFAALLAFLRTTTILHFEYEPQTELLKLRGTRASTDEDLGVEVIRMLRK
ncbi:hypothetical protein JCM10450v2_005744 [Rhodotorula kratochvilovae]